ncbi:hypothetical protein BaRGS_00026355 [Batillaria attramentaria]|uniref:Uncharacterized protein n=1 Tax=Batillaria attramentaria TaxID=370345 RepID=A0ABD0K5S6_9CAEN
MFYGETDAYIGRCAYVVIAMALLWVTEAIPIPVTALIPVVMFPALSILTATDVANSYMGNTSLLFIGGLLVAIAVEESGLHRRVALGVLKFVGSEPKWIMLGLMIPTWFLSMWISNTATASMMVPIVEAVLVQLRTAYKPTSEQSEDAVTRTTGFSRSMSQESSNLSSVDLQVSDDTDVTKTQVNGVANKHVSVEISKEADPEDNESDDVSSDVDLTEEEAVAHQRLCKGLSLSIAYAANTGGIATLTGTPPNLVFSGQADLYFKKYGGESGVTFLRWMIMAFPLSLMMLILCWLWLTAIFLRGSCKKQPKETSNAVKRVIQNEYKRLGKISFAEIETLICFILVALLWLSREPKFVAGWSDLFHNGYMSDSTAAVAVSLLFFVLPQGKPTIFCWRYRAGIKQKPSYTPLLTWQVAQAKMPWGIIILLGGGFALAKGCKFSGLSDWFGDQLTAFESLDPWLINLVICVAVAMATEITSNTATATLLMPIMAELSLRLNVNPLYFMSSAALATSFAFMMPVATPPNAIVFSHGHLKISDMAAAGAMMNVIAVVCLCLCVNTWGDAVFSFTEIPAIFNITNGTVAASDLRMLTQTES